MSYRFNLNLSSFVHALERSPEAVGRGARKAMHDIKDDWVKEARDIAPLEKGNLRQQIHGNVTLGGDMPKVIVTANASQHNFNYAYYIHEGHMAARGKKLRTAGTVEKFLEESAEEAKWKQWLENEIRAELRRAGW